MRTGMFALGSAVWMSLIFCLSSLPADRLGPDSLVLDLVKKAGHFAMFGILAVLYLHTMKGKRSAEETGIVLFFLSFFFTVIYAVTDEYHQSFTPGRHSSGRDVFIDSCGAILFLGFFQSESRTILQKWIAIFARRRKGIKKG